MRPDDLRAAHAYSLNNMPALAKDRSCGCFHCLKVFDPREITEYVEDRTGSAICPYCGIDSILGESAGFPLTEDFLKAMRRYWFGL